MLRMGGVNLDNAEVIDGMLTMGGSLDNVSAHWGYENAQYAAIYAMRRNNHFGE